MLQVITIHCYPCNTEKASILVSKFSIIIQDTVHFRMAVGSNGEIGIRSTEDCKLVVRLQMQNTLGIVVIGQLDE